MCDRKACRESVDKYSENNYIKKIKKNLEEWLSV